MSRDRPSHRYYREMAGSWRGRLTLALTDRAALARASMGSLDRFAWRLTSLQARLLGPAWLETSVDVSRIADGVVVHTTRLRQLGIVAVRGVETITLDPDGERFTLEGAHRFAWAPWRARAVRGEGRIRPDAEGASYTLSYLGAIMTQTTRIEGRDLAIVQTTPFARGEVKLVRR
jgi:hypothetical protein